MSGGNNNNCTTANSSFSGDVCSDQWTGLQVKYSFATEGVGLFSVAIVGILANAISIIVLTQRTMKTQISALLITLAVFDILFLFCTFPVFTVQSVNSFVEYLNGCVYPDASPIQFLSPWMTEVYNLSLPFLYGLTHVSKVGSVFTTLAVSLERYFAVCRPLWIRIRRCHPAMYIVIVTLFAFGFNIPKFMEFETRLIDNRTTIVATSLRTNEDYIVYYNFWTKTFLTELVPYGCLIFFNASIYREIRRSVKIQQIMRCTQSQKEEIKSANVVVGVVLLSILCHIWKIVPDLYEAIMKLRGSRKEEAEAGTETCSQDDAWNINIEFIIDTSHLLVGINSASNFFIYCLLRKNFRAATWRLLTWSPLPTPPDAHTRQATLITRASRISSRNGSCNTRRSPMAMSASPATANIEEEDDENSFFEIDGIAMTDRTTKLLQSNHHYHHLHPNHQARLHHHSSIRSNNGLNRQCSPGSGGGGGGGGSSNSSVRMSKGGDSSVVNLGGLNGGDGNGV